MLHTRPNYSLFNIGKLFSGLDNVYGNNDYSSISIRAKELGDIERVSLPSVTSRGVSV